MHDTAIVHPNVPCGRLPDMQRKSRLVLGVAVALSLWGDHVPGLVERSDAAEYTGYRSLDSEQPITFDGATVTWNGRTFHLDEQTVFLDQRLDEARIAENPYAFRSIHDAAAALRSGTKEKPMRLLVAPGVYWVDDPDDAEVRVGADGGPPVGLTITCDHLTFYGLNTRRENVVFAVNRGQTQGAIGNFTMFRIVGVGLKSENVTFGNYCNVDLEFPLDPTQNRARRADAIAQAQLFHYAPHDGVAINSAFVSRLNLLPFATTYVDCHIESSGHASFHNAVYVGCTLKFQGSNFTAGKFLDCDITLEPGPAALRSATTHVFGFRDGTGVGGACIDTRFHRSREMVEHGIAAEISWDRAPQSTTTRGYQHNVTLDGKPYVIQEAFTPGATVVLAADAELLRAYKVTHEGRTYYNVPNIEPGVDPSGVTGAIEAAASAQGKSKDHFLRLPHSAALRVASGSPAAIRSGQTTTRLDVSVAPTVHATSPALGPWRFIASVPAMVDFTPVGETAVVVAGTNSTHEPVDVLIVARNQLVLEACVELTVEPAFLPPPSFSREPVITAPTDGRVTLDFELDAGPDAGADRSSITWYRCTDGQGADPLKVSVTRRDRPETTYTLTEGDVGHFLMATIEPQRTRSEAGPPRTVFLRSAIAPHDITHREIDTDFRNFPIDPQPRILPCTWTLDGALAPEATEPGQDPLYMPAPDSWTYGRGQSGSLDYFGLDQTARGARLFYTPAAGERGDMDVCARFAPDKNGGQGFGSATQQFLDVYIKYDLSTRTGYGLRIQRLTTDEITAIGYDGAGAVSGCAFFLVRHTNGITTPVSDKIMSSAFVAECTVDLSFRQGRLSAAIRSTATSRGGDAFGYLREVRLDALVPGNPHGGTGLLFTGSVGSNSVLVTHWRTTWSEGESLL
ncbi:hypothetical protein ASA1KI_43820 [Opitutales bacterium ASA1]|nr:hypothetical protein ASA1KI_43820 [Opitutales bacterium ASA1]